MSYYTILYFTILYCPALGVRLLFGSWPGWEDRVRPKGEARAGGEEPAEGEHPKPDTDSQKHLFLSVPLTRIYLSIYYLLLYTHLERYIYI